MNTILLQFFHEANAFTPVRNSLEDFRKRYLISSEAGTTRFRGTKTWMGGLLDSLAEQGAKLRVGVCTASHPGGLVERQTYETIRKSLLDSLAALLDAEKADAVILLLHGALGVEGVEDPDGEITESVRHMIGADTPLLCTVDFHANISPGIEDAADIIVGGREYPHTDTYERGKLVGNFARQLTMGATLKTWCFHLPLVTPLPAQSTVSPGPMAEIRHAAEGIQERYRLDDLTLLGGFPYLDTPWTGMGVLVTGSNADLAVGAFRELAELVMRHRRALVELVPPIRDVLPNAIAAVSRGTVVLADVGDNPGSGGTGDDVTLLRAILESGVPFTAGAFIDPAVCRAAAAAGPRAHLKVSLGGKHGNWPALELDAVVERTGLVAYRNSGPMMTGELVEGGLGCVLRAGAGTILVVTERIQIYDAEGFLSQGMTLSGNRIVCMKSSVHFRASFEPMASGGVFLADSLGYSSTRLHISGQSRMLQTRLSGHELSEEEWAAEVEREIVRTFGLVQ
jgi:microcystin degradation protein MlrC